MSNTGIILSFTLITGLALVMSLNHCEDDSDSNLTNFDIHLPATERQSYPSNVIRIELTSPTDESGHPYLNTINWELRQPHDFSRSTITTTVNSLAQNVRFTYRCGELESISDKEPENGLVNDLIEWECDSTFTAKLEAFSGDTIVQFEYSIDIAFLNSLGLQ